MVLDLLDNSFASCDRPFLVGRVPGLVDPFAFTAILAVILIRLFAVESDVFEIKQRSTLLTFWRLNSLRD